MKLKNNINITQLVESFYFNNYDEYKDLFDAISTAEFDSNAKLNLSKFQNIASKYVNSYDKIRSGEIIECLYLIYNWYKYRLIYSIKNPDKTLTHFNNKVSSDIVKSKFFDTFFIEYDFSNSIYVGTFVDISKSQITLGLIKKPDIFWNIEPIVLDLNYSVETNVRQAYSHYLSNAEYYSDAWTDPIEKELFPKVIASNSEVINATTQTLCIIRAIMQGYQNLSNNSTHNYISTLQKEHDKTNTVKCSVRKKQLIVVEAKTSDNIHKYKPYPTCLAGTPKSPHPRREHTRKIKDDSPIGYHEVKVKSTIVHKDQYKASTEKVVK